MPCVGVHVIQSECFASELRCTTSESSPSDLPIVLLASRRRVGCKTRHLGLLCRWRRSRVPHSLRTHWRGWLPGRRARRRRRARSQQRLRWPSCWLPAFSRSGDRDLQSVSCKTQGDLFMPCWLACGEVVHRGGCTPVSLSPPCQFLLRLPALAAACAQLNQRA